MGNDIRQLWNRIVLCLAAISWGGLLLLPGDLFAETPVYSESGLYASDGYWGAFIIVFGLLLLFIRIDFITLLSHAFIIVFWDFVAWLILTSSGFSESILLLAIPFFTLSLLHLGGFISSYTKINKRGENDE